jgi:hypothetical protein
MNRIDISKLKEIESQLGEFDIDQVLGGDKSVYLRFGYWRRVDIDKLNSILAPFNTVVENDFYDDDCGWKYSYRFI